jgi:hypothetical protein
MKRYSGFSMVAVAVLFLQGCFGSGGSSAPAPNNVKVVAKDSRVVVAWDVVDGVQYWLYKALGTGVTPQTCSSMTWCTTSIGVVSPTTLWGLSNGATYSFSINGRIEGGPGGPGSAAVEATPRLAGATWTGLTPAPGTIPNNTTVLRGVAYGAMYVAAGDSGALYSGTVYTNAAGETGITWKALTNPSPGTTFYTVNYNAALAKYLVAGAGGVILESSDAATWTPLTSVTTKTANNLHAIANANGYIVATGDSGTVITSNGGLAWTAQISGTPNALNGVIYGNSSLSSTGYYFVAVGALGTIIHSEDGVNWHPSVSGVGDNLTGVTYGNGVFIAVGANGRVLTSPNGVDWTPRTSISSVSTATINAITYLYGHRFIAVAADGNIFYSEYSNAGVDWTPITPKATASSLNAVATGGLLDYSAVGAGGVNLYAD